MYMMTTINISLPTSMYDDIKKVLAQKGYSSVSELVRDSLRDILYPTTTVNGFTPEFEQSVLDAEKEGDYMEFDSVDDMANYIENNEI